MVWAGEDGFLSSMEIIQISTWRLADLAAKLTRLQLRKGSLTHLENFHPPDTAGFPWCHCLFSTKREVFRCHSVTPGNPFPSPQKELVAQKATKEQEDLIRESPPLIKNMSFLKTLKTLEKLKFHSDAPVTSKIMMLNGALLIWESQTHIEHKKDNLCFVKCVVADTVHTW